MSPAFSDAQLTRRGGRAENQDFALAATAGDARCWILADGLGGQGGGATASNVACAAIADSFRANPAVTREALHAHFLAADRAVRQAQLQSAFSGMRTTLVVLIANPAQAIWGHVGDSRLYHFRGGALLDQTRDHSVPQTLADAGEIHPAEIRRHEDRSRLLRAIGDECEVRPSLLEQPVAIDNSDAFLLCSDETAPTASRPSNFTKAAEPRARRRFFLQGDPHQHR